MHIKLKPLKRRFFLRGGLGTAIALPTLQAMFNSDSAFAAEGVGKPRFLAVYQANGHQADTFYPAATGLRDLDFSGCHAAPLADHMDSIPSGKNFHSASSQSTGNAHHVAITSWLSARPIPSHAATVNSITADRYIADYYEENFSIGKSQHEVLEASHFYQPGNGVSNDEQKNWLSTDASGNKIPPSMDLDAALDRMLSGGIDESIPAEQREAIRRQERSRIDYVMDDVHRLESRLGAADRQVVGSYLENIRKLEQNLSQPLPEGSSCGDHDSSIFEYRDRWVDHVHNTNGHDFIDLHWRDAMQLFAIGFQCEAIRSVAYMLESETGNSDYDEGLLGEPSFTNNHGLSHNPTQPGYGYRDERHARVFSEMVQLFKDTPVGDSNLLDQSLVIWGGGIGVTHSKDRLMAVVAGRGGSDTINHGALRDMNNQSQIPLMRTLLLHMGVIDETESFGDAGPGEVIDMTS